MTPIVRNDQQRVITDDGRIWDYMSPIGLDMSPVQEGPGRASLRSDGYEPIIFEVARNQLDPHYIERWMRRIGRHTSVLVVGLTADGWPYSSIAIGGKVAAVELAAYDADDADVARDRIVIQPITVATLD